MLKNKDRDSHVKENVLEEEFELVHQAIFTDPDDQSGWFYYLWLLDQTTSHSPSLISLWPTNGSNIILSNNVNTNDQISETISDYARLNGTLPIVLCFNQPVKGINSSTVSVQSSFTVNKYLTWKPLANGNTDEACYWMTCLELPKRKSDVCTSYPVEVTLNHCHGGIVSSSYSELNGSYKFNFTLDIKYTDLEALDNNLFTEMFVWEDENSHKRITLAPEIICRTSLEQLQLTITPEPAEASKWCRETLSNEVSLFRELLSEMDWLVYFFTLHGLSDYCTNCMDYLIIVFTAKLQSLPSHAYWLHLMHCHQMSKRKFILKRFWNSMMIWWNRTINMLDITRMNAA